MNISWRAKSSSSSSRSRVWAALLCARHHHPRLRIASGPLTQPRRRTNRYHAATSKSPSFLIRALISYLVSLYLVFDSGGWCANTHTHTRLIALWSEEKTSAPRIDSKESKDCRRRRRRCRCHCNHSPEFPWWERESPISQPHHSEKWLAGRCLSLFAFHIFSRLRHDPLIIQNYNVYRPVVCLCVWVITETWNDIWQWHTRNRVEIRTNVRQVIEKDVARRGSNVLTTNVGRHLAAVAHHSPVQ